MRRRSTSGAGIGMFLADQALVTSMSDRTFEDVFETAAGVRPFPYQVTFATAASLPALEAALAVCGGKVFGDGGAAKLLGMKPTTLASRLKALGIDRKRN